MSTWRERFTVHPAADVFPMMSDEELAELGADIKAHGLRVRIIEWSDPEDGEVFLIDGRNRLEAMERMGLNHDQLSFAELISVPDPVPIIIGLNAHRRHLTQADRARAIVAAARFRHHGGTGLSPGRGKQNPIRQDAFTINDSLPKKRRVGRRTIERVLAHEAPSDHPNAPPKLRAKARRQKKRETLQHYHALLATLPRTVEGARRFYLEVVSRHAVDVAAEMERVVDGLQRIASQPEAERLKKRAKG